MSRRFAALAALALALTGCASAAAPARTPPRPTASPPAATAPAPEETPQASAGDDVEIDLTNLSSTLVFAELTAMSRTPEQYLGKRVRMQGQLALYQANPAMERKFFSLVVIQDATACCQQGLEFLWEDGTLPPAGTELMVTGRYEAYDCGGLPSYHLVAEKVEWEETAAAGTPEPMV